MLSECVASRKDTFRFKKGGSSEVPFGGAFGEYRFRFIKSSMAAVIDGLESE